MSARKICCIWNVDSNIQENPMLLASKYTVQDSKIGNDTKTVEATIMVIKIPIADTKLDLNDFISGNVNLASIYALRGTDQYQAGKHDIREYNVEFIKNVCHTTRSPMPVYNFQRCSPVGNFNAFPAKISVVVERLAARNPSNQHKCEDTTHQDDHVYPGIRFHFFSS